MIRKRKFRHILQHMVEDRPFEDLPSSWNSFDVKSFSEIKTLYDFQQSAIKNIIKCLYLYFKEDNGEKSVFYRKYVNNGLDENLDIKLSKLRRKIADILQQYYPIEEGSVGFSHLINRAASWMATGSGKTLVIVKLVEVLKRLMDSGEIPKKDILILTHRDYLIRQLKTHVNEFNELSIERGFRINLVELTEYENTKRESLRPFFDETVVFYYRADLISDEQKEKIVDFRNYENDGNWYVILDEAHKGDKEESKRQALYSIMARNGFLFNFSAIFVDPSDWVTNVYDFALGQFVKEGYGKHIYILQQEVRAFREKEDYNWAEKQKIVLKALVLLTYIKKIHGKATKIRKDVYHEPLMLALVNTVNLSAIRVEKPDLKLFFEEIEKIGKGDVDEKTLETAKRELEREFLEKPALFYEEKIPVNIRGGILNSITLKDILRFVYNSESHGSIEALTIPEKRQEAAFKLKTSDKPFASIKIADAIRWIKDNLSGYEINESYEDKSIFENIEKRSDISILMGSRSFYEGWDSNRPNVILFINIGVGTDAKKFVTQSTGRGVRIEPIKGKRKRLLELHNANQDEGTWDKLKKLGPLGGPLQHLETVFIFGTNRDALKEVMETLNREGPGETIELTTSDKAKYRALLIPLYKKSPKKLCEEKKPRRFLITNKTLLNAIGEYFTTVDDRVLVMRHHIPPKFLRRVGVSFGCTEKYYSVSPNHFVPFDIGVSNIIKHFNLNFEELDKFKHLEEEIIHFKKIRVVLKTSEEINELKRKVKKVAGFKDTTKTKKVLIKKVKKGEITDEECISEMKKLDRLSKEELFKNLRIKYVVNHYYLPLILSTEERADYIKHIIKTRSEVDFLNKLETCIQSMDETKVDWWMFSKIDEHTDKVYIPYHDRSKHIIRHFLPDFIFWLNKGKEYFIVFVDPKSTKYTEFQYKVDWFKRIFGDMKSPRVFEFGGLKIRVLLFLFTPKDVSELPEGYRDYWFDNPDFIFSKVKAILSKTRR